MVPPRLSRSTRARTPSGCSRAWGAASSPTRPIFPTPATGLVVRAVDFNGAGLTGLAVLGPDGLSIYQSNGHGGFLPPTEYDVGFEPNGLTVADLTGNGIADLLVSNPLRRRAGPLR